MPESYISKITLPSGSQYVIKDKNVWGSNDPTSWASSTMPGSTYMTDVVEALKAQIAAITGGDAIVFKGVSTAALTQGGNENPVVGGSTVTTKTVGDLYFYEYEEFIYGDDGKWHSLGPQMTLFGDLAYKDAVSVKYDKTTSITSTFTGTAGDVTITTAANNSGNYTPSGTITGGTFTGSNTTFTGNYTPGGTVSQPTFSGATLSSTAAYTPGGSVSAPTISVATAGSTATIKNPTKVTVAKTVAAAAPTSSVANEVTYYSVANENLTLYKIGYTTGDSITTSNVTVKTGDAAYSSSQPTFTGTASTVTTKGTPSGTVSQPTFSGTAATVSVSGTPNGSVSDLEFNGTKVKISGTVTPAGSVTSTPNNTNTNATVSYS